MARRYAGSRRTRPRPSKLSRRVRVLVANAGSSSLKLSLLDSDDSQLWECELDAPRARIEAERVAAALAELPASPDVVGHRIVHGGERFREAVIIDADVEEELRELSVLAPLQQPKSLAAIEAVKGALPQIRAAACFDTAFHATLPPLRLPLALARLRRARRRRGVAGRDVPPRRGCLALCSARRPLGRHNDGFHTARGPRHGDPLRVRRPRPPALAPAAGGRLVRRDGAGARARVRAPWPRRHRRHARAAGARRRRRPAGDRRLRAPPPRRHRRDGGRARRARRARLHRRCRRELRAYPGARLRGAVSPRRRWGRGWRPRARRPRT